MLTTQPQGLSPQRGELARGLVVVNNLRTRGRCPRADIFEQVRQKVQLDIVGIGTRMTGRLGEAPPPELPAFTSHCCFVFNPICYTVLDPRFFDMVWYATDKGIRVSTNSNLMLLNARRAERCVTSGLEWLYVPLDGAYERICVRSRFERVVRNLKLITQACEHLGSVHPHS